jgi:hydroxymethylglutaryl-CoA reductase
MELKSRALRRFAPRNDATLLNLGISVATDSRLPNFRILTPAQRLAYIANAAYLNANEAALLAKPGALNIERADGMIENAIGTFELPFAVADSAPCNDGH